MADAYADLIVLRLQSAEANIQTLTQRVFRLEQSSRIPSTPPPPVTPPPIAAIRGAESSQTQSQAWQVVPPLRPDAVTTKSNDRSDQVNDLEYKIGLTGLVRGGAAIIVLAMIYLVALAVSRNAITPLDQFVGEIALCFGFIGFGFVKRSEKEEFGQLLIGIGSCGMYLSFAGGHLYKQLYSGETLVGLFLVLSFVNLAYSWLRSSRSFLAIGMLGGLTAAMLPMHKYNPTLDVALHLLILVPTAMIVVKNRWEEVAAAMWAVSTLALIPALTYDSVWIVRVGGLYTSSLICAAAYAATWKKDRFDQKCTLSAVAIVVAGVGALVADSVDHGSLHILALSLAGGLVGLGFTKNREARNALWLGSAVVAVALSPVGFHRVEATAVYGIVSVLLAIGSLRVERKALSALAALDLALALVAYLSPWHIASLSMMYTLGAESALLVLLMTATAATAYASQKAGVLSQPVVIAAGVLWLPLFSRLGFIVLTSPAIHLLADIALLIPFLAFSVLCIAVGNANKWMSAVVLGWISLALSFIAYIDLAFLSDTVLTHRLAMAAWVESAIALGLISVTLAAAAACYRQVTKTAQDLNVACSGLAIGLMLFRLSYIWLGPSGLGLSETTAQVFGLAAIGILSALIAARTSLHALVTQSWGFVGVAALLPLFMSVPESANMAVQVSSLALTIVGVLCCAYANSKGTSDRTQITAASVLLIWLLTSRIGSVLLRATAMKADPALSLTWIVFAVVLIAVGFSYSNRLIRFWSLGVFGATLAKVLLFDLSGLDPGIRVGVLMALGFGMLGAGYWYIRTRPMADPTRTPINHDQVTGG